MSLADRAGLDLALAEPVAVEERPQRLEHQQRRAAVPRASAAVWTMSSGAMAVLTGPTLHGDRPPGPQPSPPWSVSTHHVPNPQASPHAARLRPRRSRAGGARGARLARPDHLLRGLARPAQRQDAPARARADAGARRQSAARRAQLVQRRAEPEQRHQAGLRSDEPRAVRVGRIRQADRRSSAAEMEGAADGHLAGAALGDIEQESAVRHKTRPERLPGIHDRRGPALRPRRSRSTRSGTSPTTRRSCCRSGTPTARPPHRASTAPSTRPAMRGCRPPARPSRSCCSARPPRRATAKSTTSAKNPRRCCTTSRRSRSCAGRCA